MDDLIKEHVTIVGDICILVVPSGESVLFECEDYDLVKGYKWMARRTNRTCIYATAIFKKPDGKITSVLMHRLIMGFPERMFVDHDNGSGLDNRRGNLAIVTPQQNAMNKKCQGKSVPVAKDAIKDTRTGFVGVSISDKMKHRMFRAYINTGGRDNPKHHELIDVLSQIAATMPNDISYDDLLEAVGFPSHSLTYAERSAAMEALCPPHGDYQAYILKAGKVRFRRLSKCSGQTCTSLTYGGALCAACLAAEQQTPCPGYEGRVCGATTMNGTLCAACLRLEEEDLFNQP